MGRPHAVGPPARQTRPLAGFEIDHQHLLTPVRQPSGDEGARDGARSGREGLAARQHASLAIAFDRQAGLWLRVPDTEQVPGAGIGGEAVPDRSFRITQDQREGVDVTLVDPPEREAAAADLREDVEQHRLRPGFVQPDPTELMGKRCHEEPDLVAMDDVLCGKAAVAVQGIGPRGRECGYGACRLPDPLGAPRGLIFVDEVHAAEDRSRTPGRQLTFFNLPATLVQSPPSFPAVRWAFNR